MANFAKPDEFNPENEQWTAYVERMELFFEAHDVEDEKRVATLLSSVGASAYGLLRNLIQPLKPKDKTFDEIVVIMSNYYEPKPLVVAERFRFRRRVQKNDATVAQFAADLKQLAARCNFGDRLDEALRDGFVSGIRDEACQHKLLSTDGLTFARAQEIALNMEAAHRDTRQLRQSETPSASSVHKVKEKQKPSPSAQAACYRCRGKNHSPSECYFKTAKCHKCDKFGHIQKACRGSQPAAREKKGRLNKTQRKVASYVIAEEEEEVFCVNETDKQVFKANFSVNRRNVLMEIDTGAAVSIISEAMYRESFADVLLGASNVTLKTYTGQAIPVRGQFVAKVTYGDQTVDLPLIVVKGNGPALCGRNWLESIKLDWKTIKMISENAK
ncbi:uncharacterized protein LOC143485419 [Brachyhypopomus gauderio]|uniref:uncharacterized protein LOC143485419 n=1 Tax=Brachyhypopomus gauderio TaxID=698409 RepID=UPI00404283B8